MAHNITRTKRGAGNFPSIPSFFTSEPSPPTRPPLRSQPLPPPPAVLKMIEDEIRRTALHEGDVWMKNKLRNFRDGHGHTHYVTRASYEEFLRAALVENRLAQNQREREQKWKNPPPPSQAGKIQKRKGTKRKGTKRKGTKRKGTKRKGTKRKGTKRKLIKTQY